MVCKEMSMPHLYLKCRNNNISTDDVMEFTNYHMQINTEFVPSSFSVMQLLTRNFRKKRQLCRKIPSYCVYTCIQ